MSSLEAIVAVLVLWIVAAYLATIVGVLELVRWFGWL